jgi:hypothetical protein
MSPTKTPSELCFTGASTAYWMALSRTAGENVEVSELGAFLDLLGDFLVYSAIPISCGLAVSALDNLKQPFPSMSPTYSPWLSISTLEAAFHMNNFALFYGSTVIEKQKQDRKTPKEATELTAIPTLVESFEGGMIFYGDDNLADTN